MIIIENFIIIYKYLINKINPSYYSDIKFIGYNEKNKNNTFNNTFNNIINFIYIRIEIKKGRV
jgi:hypothetical protein